MEQTLLNNLRSISFFVRSQQKDGVQYALHVISNVKCWQKKISAVQINYSQSRLSTWFKYMHVDKIVIFHLTYVFYHFGSFWVTDQRITRVLQKHDIENPKTTYYYILYFNYIPWIQKGVKVKIGCGMSRNI